MEYFLGLGFVMLCYFLGKSELEKTRAKIELEQRKIRDFTAMAVMLPPEERSARIKEFLDKMPKQ